MYSPILIFLASVDTALQLCKCLSSALSFRAMIVLVLCKEAKQSSGQGLGLGAMLPNMPADMEHLVCGYWDIRTDFLIFSHIHLS